MLRVDTRIIPKKGMPTLVPFGKAAQADTLLVIEIVETNVGCVFARKLGPPGPQVAFIIGDTGCTRKAKGRRNEG